MTLLRLRYLLYIISTLENIRLKIKILSLKSNKGFIIS
jgi:hypothetical protein